MDRRSTGNHELDRILGGGLPNASLVVIAGPPGSGKTILAHQLAYTNATSQHPAYYYSTLSEPQSKLVRHLREFRFFEEAAIGERVHVLNLDEFAQQQPDGHGRLSDIVDDITTTAFATHPAVVIIDSSRALRQLGEPGDIRAAIFSLASRIAHTGANLILVGEYTHGDLEEAPEFAIADVILELTNDPRGGYDHRTLRVAKLRGSQFLAGEHPYTINASGLDVDARIDSTPEVLVLQEGRTTFDAAQLNAMTGGGIPRGDAVMVLGPTGAGKTTLALHFIAAGLAANEPALWVALEETPAEIEAKAETFGLPFKEARASGLLRLIHAPPRQTDLDHLGRVLRDAVVEHSPQRIVFDAMSSLLPAIRQADRSPRYQAALTATLRAGGATTLFTSEVRALGDGDPTYEMLSNLVPNVIILRYMERGSELGRVLSVLKMRRSRHDKGLLRYDIGPKGIQLLGEANDVRHITGWTVLGSPTANA